MSITREDLFGVADGKDMKTLSKYWTQEDEQLRKDHIGKSPLDMVKEFQEVTQQKTDPDLYIQLIVEEFEEWDFEVNLRGNEFSKHYRQEHNPEAELKELADLAYVLYGYANARGYDLDEAFRRVHENNMGRMYQPDGTIKRRADGKIIKNKDYPKVDLGDLV